MTRHQNDYIETILNPYDYIIIEPHTDPTITPDIIDMLDTIERELEAANLK